MKIVYWSPWYPSTDFASLHLLYDEPKSVLSSIKYKQNKTNKHDNWFQCHAFLNTVKNSFVLESPFEVTFGLHSTLGIMQLPESDLETIKFVTKKEATVENAFTFSILNNWIFWSDEPLEMVAMPAYLHPQVFNGHFVPGTFNINSWFRPVEAAIQLNENVNFVSIKKGDPIAYVKFNTEKPVILKRFHFDQDLMNLSQACIDYKKYQKSSSLTSLYSRFNKNGLQKAISKSIKKNIME